jgi:ribosomal protein S18 acetylase RimI-like enzyme
VVLEIVRATAGDAAQVRSIMLAAFAEYQGVLRPPSSSHTETVADVEAAITAGGAVLAREDGAPAGAARFEWHEDHLYVGRVAVLPPYRHRGIAAAMMRYFEDMAREKAVRRVRVGVRMSLSRNVALFERLGYRLVDISPHPRGPDRVGTLIKDLVD